MIAYMLTICMSSIGSMSHFFANVPSLSGIGFCIEIPAVNSNRKIRNDHNRLIETLFQ